MFTWGGASSLVKLEDVNIWIVLIAESTAVLIASDSHNRRALRGNLLEPIHQELLVHTSMGWATHHQSSRVEGHAMDLHIDVVSTNELDVGIALVALPLDSRQGEGVGLIQINDDKRVVRALSILNELEALARVAVKLTKRSASVLQGSSLVDSRRWNHDVIVNLVGVLLLHGVIIVVVVVVVVIVKEFLQELGSLRPRSSSLLLSDEALQDGES